MSYSKSLSFIYVFLLIASSCTGQKNRKEYDVVIYGGTSAGISAAIQTSRMNKSVVLIEPSKRIGGLTTGGLGQTDIGNKQAIGGISREFYINIKEYYQKPETWKWQKKDEFRDEGQSKTNAGEGAMWTFEPSAAMAVYNKMIALENIDLVLGERLDRQTGVKKEGMHIVEIVMENGKSYKGKMFIDATYEGDLMAAAGVSYTVGRESNELYGETLNGNQANKTSLTLRGTLSHNNMNHNFLEGVDPYIRKGDSSSGLLPFVEKDGKGIAGAGDKRIQAYCFRMTLTDHPENRLPFVKPEGYEELEYELLFRNYEIAETGKKTNPGNLVAPWINSKMPNRKTDTNNRLGFSTDFIGKNYEYSEASYQERAKIIERHRIYQQGLMWTLAYHPRIPEEIRSVVSQWGTCRDEFTDSGGWTDQLYVREARRMISDYVMTQKNCEGLIVAGDPVGLGAYGMDSHNVRRFIDDNGFVQNEGNVEAAVPGPYPVSYKSIIPGKSECNNLLVPVCVSATHIAFGSIRMEPVFMVLGQSAATAACIAIDKRTTVHAVNYEELKIRLLRDGQVLK